MKHLSILAALFFILTLSHASTLVTDTDSSFTGKTELSRAKANKKFTLHIEVTSPTCLGSRQILNLKKDEDLINFYDFEVLNVDADSTDYNKCTSYISYQGIFLGVIHGVPTKSFLLSLRPTFNDMIRDPKIMSQRKDSMASIVGVKK